MVWSPYQKQEKRPRKRSVEKQEALDNAEIEVDEDLTEQEKKDLEALDEEEDFEDGDDFEFDEDSEEPDTEES